MCGGGGVTSSQHNESVWGTKQSKTSFAAGGCCSTCWWNHLPSGSSEFHDQPFSAFYTFIWCHENFTTSNFTFPLSVVRMSQPCWCKGSVWCTGPDPLTVCTCWLHTLGLTPLYMFVVSGLKSKMLESVPATGPVSQSCDSSHLQDSCFWSSCLLVLWWNRGRRRTFPLEDVHKDASCISCHSQASYFLL